MSGKVTGIALCRLGNQMFCTAAAKTYAKRNKKEFIGMVRWNNQIPNYPSKGILETVLRNVNWVSENDTKEFKRKDGGEFLCNGFPEINAENVLLNDLFQDVNCIDKDIAYELFAPYDSIKNSIKDLYGDLSNHVCVHVRRGDYLGLKGLGFKVLNKKDIDNILNQYFPNAQVMFVSDDINWCKKNFIGEKYHFADKPYQNPEEIDLYIQTQCGKGNIMSTSTFSWWGAYLNESEDKTVVCPWPWFSLDKYQNGMATILPDNWIKYKN